MAHEETTPVSIAAAVTVLPTFGTTTTEPKPARSRLRRRPAHAHADPSLHHIDVPDSPASLIDAPTAAMPVVEGTHAVAPPGEVPAMRAPGLSVIAAAVVEPVVVSPSVADLSAALRRECERADSAEAANAVLRRRLAQLDDELSQFRPRAIVPFEDNTH